MAYSVTNIQITSGNGINISENFNTTYSNSPAPYGTITITPKDEFTVENPLPVKVWVSYKSDGTDCPTKYFDFTIPGSGGGGGGSISVEPASWSWDYNKSGSANKKVFTITKDNNVHIESIGLSGRDDNKFQLGETGQTSFEVYPKANNTDTTDFEALVIVSYTVDGGSGRVINVQLTQFKGSSPGPTPTPGILEVQPTECVWEYNNTENKTVTYNAGDGVSVASIAISGNSDYAFEIVSETDSEVVVKPVNTLSSNQVLNGYLCFTYTVNGGYTQTKVVNLIQTGNGSGGYIIVTPSTKKWEHDDISSQDFVYTIGGGYSITSIGLEGSKATAFSYVVGDGVVKVAPKDVNTGNFENTAYLRLNYSKGGSYIDYKRAFLEQKNGVEWIKFTPETIPWWYADEYGSGKSKTVEIEKGDDITITSIAFSYSSSAEKFNLTTGDTSFSVYPLSSNEGSTSNKIGEIKVIYKNRSGDFSTKYFSLTQSKDSSPKPPGI